MANRFQLALLCGGPSLERGISLNSARSVCDHIQSDAVEVIPFYFDHQKKSYLISRAQLYSSTPSDFDFKLKSTAQPLSTTQLIKKLKRVDLVFPAMHGPFGEDGEIQAFLEQHNIPFVGSPSKACQQAFDKYEASKLIADKGFYTIPCLLLSKSMPDRRKRLERFFRSANSKQFIVKPATGGSSIAVYSVSTIDEALHCADTIFSHGLGQRVVVEPFCRGTEFTVIILENRFGMPVAILPTEIELDYTDYKIFDYRKKYLASRQVTYHCPPRFSDRNIDRIQVQAEQLFTLFGMRDFSRFDGWLFQDGTIFFSDFNPVSGMEQNSFLFMQAARIGLTHRELLRFVLRNACARYGIILPDETPLSTSKRRPVHVIFGGSTAERQVSLMSGTNVWQKLTRSKKYMPIPFLLDTNQQVWKLPYAFALNHSVEEVMAMCSSAEQDEERLRRLKQRVLDRLACSVSGIASQYRASGIASQYRVEENSDIWSVPRSMSLEKFIRSSEIVFLGLHGGIGENGAMQALLEKARVAFNGPNSKSSRLCMDKYMTGQALADYTKEGIRIARKKVYLLSILRNLSPKQMKVYWRTLTHELEAETIIVKPLDDGCSAGVARLFNADDLKTYVRFAHQGSAHIPSGCLTEQHGIVEMPSVPMKKLLFEEYIVTDRVEAHKNKLDWQSRTGWVEVTVGILQEKARIRALNPSITVAEGGILSLEEKFQGGTGINITPPPSPYVSREVIAKVKARVTRVAQLLGIEGYARIDCFMHIQSGEIIVIEVNTLPGLTPATVIFHQALAERPALYPLEFLEKIVDHAVWRKGRVR